jgi:hypothetical protein
MHIIKRKDETDALKGKPPVTILSEPKRLQAEIHDPIEIMTGPSRCR